MKDKERDILAEHPELKNLPYSIPEGYFDEFRAKAEATRPRRNAIPYLSAAASAALLVGAGLHFMNGGSVEELTQEDFLVFSDSVINTEYYENMNPIADAEIADEDIVDYLIYSGISVEEIENLK